MNSHPLFLGFLDSERFWAEGDLSDHWVQLGVLSEGASETWGHRLSGWHSGCHRTQAGRTWSDKSDQAESWRPGEQRTAGRGGGCPEGRRESWGRGGGMPTSPRFPRDAINHPNCSVMWSVDTRIILKCCSDQNTCTRSHTHTNVHTRSHRLINTHMLTHKCTHPQARSTLVHAMVNPPQALHVTRQDSEPWVLF